MLLSSPWRHKSGPLEDEIRRAPHPELEALLAMHQEKLGDENAFAEWQRNVRRKAATSH
jgi:hypothetical protein